MRLAPDWGPTAARHPDAGSPVTLPAPPGGLARTLGSGARALVGAGLREPTVDEEGVAAEGAESPGAGGVVEGSEPEAGSLEGGSWGAGGHGGHGWTRS